MDFDYDKVPQEMKDAQIRLHKAIARERRARANHTGWEIEMEAAVDALAAENRVYREVSVRWNPTDDTMNPPLEDAPK